VLPKLAGPKKVEVIGGKTLEDSAFLFPLQTCERQTLSSTAIYSYLLNNKVICKILNSRSR